MGTNATAPDLNPTTLDADDLTRLAGSGGLVGLGAVDEAFRRLEPAQRKAVVDRLMARRGERALLAFLERVQEPALAARLVERLGPTDASAGRSLLTNAEQYGRRAQVFAVLSRVSAPQVFEPALAALLALEQARGRPPRLESLDRSTRGALLDHLATPLGEGPNEEDREARARQGYWLLELARSASDDEPSLLEQARAVASDTDWWLEPTGASAREVCAALGAPLPAEPGPLRVRPSLHARLDQAIERSRTRLQEEGRTEAAALLAEHRAGRARVGG